MSGRNDVKDVFLSLQDKRLLVLKADYSEILLIRAFKKGDLKAFDALFQRYHKRLYAFLFSLLKSKEDAEELVQESFIKIWEHRETYLEEYPFSAYLFTIAKNAFLNQCRRRINRKMVEEHFDMVNRSFEMAADEYVIYHQTKKIIDQVIEELPPKRKEIFKLRRIEGYTRTEIADNLGISIITVDSQLMKANKFIKEALEKHNLI